MNAVLVALLATAAGAAFTLAVVYVLLGYFDRC